MIFLKTEEEIEKIRLASDLVSRTLGEVARWVAPGVTTRRLDDVAREFILDNGGKPACLGYHGFPGTLCIEVNETVVHGFPSSYELREGDIIGTDCVVELNGEFMAYLKGKSTLMLFDRHPEYRTKWGDRHFWARGYYVSTVGNVNEETIRKYIQEQEEDDKLEDGRK